MKPKLKSLSKRTLSIILVLLMVVSTVTVGIFTTTAAYSDAPDEKNRWPSTRTKLLKKPMIYQTV